MSAEPPRVTACIPCFRSRRTIVRAVASLLAQTHRHLRIVVVADGALFLQTVENL